ncbi:TatD family hydrolase [Capnocytophaga gingivalis]|uniref:TatD family hydrolase n=1 Tax=Capnocytophaga gingivalis TaxID=1017 RepID=A0ABU5YBJ0_9FLAO|nr:TatD family hydrolase [Capnocytophaga gingivalis]MEB3041242.1 TatD family hydrolase [Capnocytophaga gingivalis]
MIIDTHTHLYVEEFDTDYKEVIQRAIDYGVEKFFLPAIDSTYTERMFRLQKEYPEHMYLMNGLHPCSVKENWQEEIAKVNALVSAHSKDFYAIGEIGIDLYWDKTFLEAQKEAFALQIRLAKEYHLPIVIHCREAFEETFEVLEKEKSDDLFGIFHCFTGNKEQALRAISFGLKLGIGGVVTFKNGKIDTFLNEIPLKHLVLETDAPYLAPVPFRGKRNESSYLIYIVKKLAEIYNISENEIIKRTTNNALEIFKP